MFEHIKFNIDKNGNIIPLDCKLTDTPLKEFYNYEANRVIN